MKAYKWILILCVCLLIHVNLQAQLFIQAEEHLSMNGVQTEWCLDEGGGQNVGWIDTDDWMDYQIEIPVTGDYVVKARAASLYGGGRVEIQEENQVLGSFGVGLTGGWQQWQNFDSGSVFLSQGQHAIKLKATVGGFNLNWFEIRLVNPVDNDLPDVPLLKEKFEDVHSVFMSWESAGDITTLVTGYKVYRDGVFWGFVQDNHIELSKLPFETTCDMAVHACDLAGNQSQPLMVTLSTKTPEWPLVWFDEFDGVTVDRTKWNFEIGGDGWGNGEAQYYTDGLNSRIENGCLVIEARQETMGQNAYTSSRMTTAHKGDFLYGRIEVRAKLPSTGGTWPAIWTLPTDWVYGNWPHCGEIDIMEHTGNNLGYVFGTVHTGAYNHMQGTQKGGGVMIPDVSDAFHVYALEWYPDHMDWYYDDQLVFSFENEYKTFEEWPYNIPHHLMLNVAVGGGLGGEIDVNGVWPQQMVVDYVRVYDFNIGTNDVIAPSAPSDLSASVSGIDVQLNWTQASDDQYVESYNIYKDGELVKIVSFPGCQFINLNPLTEYIFSVVAIDFGGNQSEEAIIHVTTGPLVSHQVPGVWEAEDYLYMNGILTEPCLDAGGGFNVAYINTYDWLEYYIDVREAGNYRFQARGAAASQKGAIQLLDETNKQLAILDIPVTGGWQNWQTSQSQPFYLKQGSQRLTVKALASNFNLNWFNLVLEPISTTINEPSIINCVYPNPASDVLYVKGVDDGSVLEVYNVHGIMVKQSVITNALISVADLEVGVYFVKVGDSVIKLIKKLAP